MSAHRLHIGFLIALLGVASAATAQAQSAAEYGSAAAKVATTTSGGKVPEPKVTFPKSTPGAQSLPLPTSNAEAEAAINRLALQKLAGQDAAELSLRSTPGPAYVWIDAVFVGTAPLELKLAPGHHRVLMRALDREDGGQEVELQGKQTRQVMLSLKPRHPDQVNLNWRARK